MIVNMVAPWGTKYHYMSGIHTNVTTVQLPSGQAWYSYLWDKPQNGEMTPLIVYRCRLQVQFRAGGKAGSGQCNGDVSLFEALPNRMVAPTGWEVADDSPAENQRFLRSWVNRITRKGKKTAATTAK
jgi:hypothetical protein